MFAANSEGPYFKVGNVIYGNGINKELDSSSNGDYEMSSKDQCVAEREITGPVSIDSRRLFQTSIPSVNSQTGAGKAVNSRKSHSYKARTSKNKPKKKTKQSDSKKSAKKNTKSKTSKSSKKSSKTKKASKTTSKKSKSKSKSSAKKSSKKGTSSNKKKQSSKKK